LNFSLGNFIVSVFSSFQVRSPDSVFPFPSKLFLLHVDQVHRQDLAIYTQP
jgi:hypothetical protein